MSEDQSIAQIEQNNVTNIDRLSDLPLNVLAKILGKLSLKETIRTSILSTKWITKWSCISRLAIQFPRGACETSTSLIFRHLVYNNNGIDMFELYGYCYQVNMNLSVWFNFPSLKGLKKLVISNSYGLSGKVDRVKLPYSLFSFQQLEYLKLVCCEISVPAAFTGFCRLSYLDLKDVLINGVFMLSGRNLRYIELESTVGNIKVGANPKLLRVNLRLNSSDVECRDKTRQMLTSLSDLTALTSASLPIEVLKVYKHEIEKPFMKNTQLSRLILNGTFYLNDINSARIFLSTIRGFPNLKELNFAVRFYTESSENYMFPKDIDLPSLKKLEMVSVEYNSQLPILAEFLHLIAGRSTVLRKLEITRCFRLGEKINEHGNMICFQKRLRKRFQKLKEVAPGMQITYNEKQFPYCLPHNLLLDP